MVRINNFKLRTHPLTKIQLLSALLWAILGISATYPEGNLANLLMFLSSIFGLTLSIVTVRIGYLQVIKRQIVIYPNNVLALRVHRFFQGPIKSNKYYQEFWKPATLKYIGVMNLITGLVCAFLSVYLFIVILFD